jgi:hypothetical protein
MASHRSARFSDLIMHRLNYALIRRYVLCQLPRFEQLLQPTVRGRRGGICRFRFRCRRSNFVQGIFEGEKWLVCHWRDGPPRYLGGGMRILALSEPTQTWPKFMLGMGWSAPVGPVPSHRRESQPILPSGRTDSDARTVYISPLKMPL